MKPSYAKKIGRFLQTESAGGMAMMAAAAMAMLLMNSPWRIEFAEFIHIPVGFSFGSWQATEPLSHWVKDILMAFFFLLVGLELKREMLEGVISEKKQMLLPLLAALGGILCPTLLFFIITSQRVEYWHGWAIPSATDIAFAVCVLMLVAPKTPHGLKILLLAIAIFDDLAAIVIIAVFYSKTIILLPLLWALLGVGGLFLLNVSHVKALTPYLLLGIFLWCCLYQSGLHPTLAGVITGMAIPLKRGDDAHGEMGHSPLGQLMHFLHPVVNFVILPIFALTTAGVDLQGVSGLSLLAVAIALSLFLGKQAGIMAAIWLMVRYKIAALPMGINWRQIYGVAVLAGIGFTMSLFIGLQAFDDVGHQEEMKLGVLLGSVLSAIWGCMVLRGYKNGQNKEGITQP
ncbi:MAG: Na+/H+ antiporter NhaA [Alphaproteobacteria bacterium]